MEKYCNVKGVQLMKAAKKNSLVDGLSVPIKSPTGEIAIFSLSTNLRKCVAQ